MDTGASAASAPSPPNSHEKATNTSATGDPSVNPNNGETSRRVCADGFHAMVGPMTKLCSGSPRVSLTVSIFILHFYADFETLVREQNWSH